MHSLYLCVSCVFFLAGPACLAQNAVSSDAAVLQELRSIRAVLTKSSTLSARTQLVMWRLEATARRMQLLTGQWERAKQEVKTAEETQQQILEFTKRSDIERGLAETPALRKAILASDIEKYKQAADKELARASELRGQEMQIANELDLEKSRHATDMAKLEEIERELTALSAENQP